MAKKNSTMKYVLIAGVVAVGYYLYTRSAVSAPVAATIDSATMGVLSSWAGSAGTSAPQYEAFISALNPSEAAFVANLVTNYWAQGKAPSFADDDTYNELKTKYGLS